MLKRVIRNRIFLFIVLLAVIGVALFAPIRREYITTVDYRSCEGCAGTFQTTKIFYGSPMAWYVLGVEENIETKEVRSETREKNLDKLYFDALVWLLVIAILSPLRKLKKFKSHAHPRN